MLLARTLVLRRPTSPIAATLRIALDEPYEIDVEGRQLRTRASLVAPKRCRRSVTAVGSDLVLLYVPIEWPEHTGLRRLLGDAPIVELDFERFAPVLPGLRAAFNGRLDGAGVKALARQTLGLLASPEDAEALDARVREACRLLADTPLNEFRTEAIARRLHLSPSRLRALFRQDIGYPIGEYARWSAVWQTVGQWRPGKRFTEAALDGGFYDLAHADHAFLEVFGMTPSAVTDPGLVSLIDCDAELPPAGDPA